MSFTVYNGDLIQMALQGNFNAIIHGANCQKTMGSGIAKHIKNVFPEAFRADLSYPHQPEDKLGRFSKATVFRDPFRFDVINAYTQLNYGYDGAAYASYDAIDKAMFYIDQEYRDMGMGSEQSIGVPAIGCGLGGLKLPVVQEIIKQRLSMHSVTMVLLPNGIG